MKIQTTFVNRANTNTNTQVFEAANQHMKQGKAVTTFGDYYKRAKVKLLGHIIRQNEGDLEQFSTIEAGRPKPIINHIRRHGKPREIWGVEAIKKAWNQNIEAMEKAAHLWT